MADKTKVGMVFPPYVFEVEKGKIAEFASGSEIDFPSLMLVLILFTSRSTTLFPAVFPTTCKASRIGTPLCSIVLRVRVNLATATFRSNIHKTGALSAYRSKMSLPFSVA